jgi:hypothetical protein
MKRSRGARRAEYEAELEMPDFPLPLLYLWKIYHRLRRRVAGTGFGAAPIEWRDLDAFNRMTGANLAPWEVEVIELIDDAFMKSMTEAAADQAAARRIATAPKGDG